ncbi:MAG: 1,6-anhydro-N-acetylmuramyl-L-alanine amidase AmpD [Cellvibrionaceae bacterium]
MSINTIHSSDETDLSIRDGWINAARRVDSPNYNDRPDIDDVSLLVIHNISLPPEQFGGGYVEQFFCNQLDCSQHEYFQQISGMEVSSHLLITREGELIQFVPFDKRAWHAGASCFESRHNCNDFSIGIELEGADTIPFTQQQYVLLSEVTQALLKQFPLMSRDRIVGHSDIAPGRKTDPGEAFDWQLYRKLLA